MAQLCRDISHPKDKGCEYASSCLNCPLPKCKEDIIRQVPEWLTQRNEKIKQMASILPTSKLGREFHVSRRTVERVLQTK